MSRALWRRRLWKDLEIFEDRVGELDAGLPAAAVSLRRGRVRELSLGFKLIPSLVQVDTGIA
jgi:hypothetical protein